MTANLISDFQNHAHLYLPILFWRGSGQVDISTRNSCSRLRFCFPKLGSRLPRDIAVPAKGY